MGVGKTDDVEGNRSRYTTLPSTCTPAHGHTVLDGLCLLSSSFLSLSKHPRLLFHTQTFAEVERPDSRPAMLTPTHTNADSAPNTIINGSEQTIADRRKYRRQTQSGNGSSSSGSTDGVTSGTPTPTPVTTADATETETPTLTSSEPNATSSSFTSSITASSTVSQSTNPGLTTSTVDSVSSTTLSSSGESTSPVSSLAVSTDVSSSSFFDSSSIVQLTSLSLSSLSASSTLFSTMPSSVETSSLSSLSAPTSTSLSTPASSSLSSSTSLSSFTSLSTATSSSLSSTDLSTSLSTAASTLSSSPDSTTPPSSTSSDAISSSLTSTQSSSISSTASSQTLSTSSTTSQTLSTSSTTSSQTLSTTSLSQSTTSSSTTQTVTPSSSQSTLVSVTSTLFQPHTTTIFTTASPTFTTVISLSTSSELETLTSTFVTTESGTPATVTTVIVGPSGSLNASDTGNKGLPKGAIAAIAVVSVLAVASVFLWLLFAFLRRRGRFRLTQSGPLFLGSGSGSGRSNSQGASSTRPLNANYGSAGFGRSNSSGFGMRTSPLHDEDADLEHSASVGSHGTRPMGESAESDGYAGYGGMQAMREVNPDTNASFSPEWWDDPSRMEALGASVARLRGGDANYTRANNTNASSFGASDALSQTVREREMGLLDAAGLGASLNATTWGTTNVNTNAPPGLDSGMRTSPPARPGPTLSFAPDPIITPRRNSIPLEKVYVSEIGEKSEERSASPSKGILLSPSPTAVNFGDGSGNVGLIRENSAQKRHSLPPSSWPYIGADTRGRSPSPSDMLQPDGLGRIRTRSSNELSSSGHGHTAYYGTNSFAVTSSQGHGSQTMEGEGGYVSGSGSSSGHNGSGSQSHSNSHSNSQLSSLGVGVLSNKGSMGSMSVLEARRRESMGSRGKRASTGSDGILMRTKESLKERLRRSSVIVVRSEKDLAKRNSAGPPRVIQPVSQLVMTKPLPQAPLPTSAGHTPTSGSVSGAFVMTSTGQPVSFVQPSTSQYQYQYATEDIPKVASSSSIARPYPPGLPPLTHSYVPDHPNAPYDPHAGPSNLARPISSSTADLPTPSSTGVPSGLLDPALSHRLREIHGTLGARSDGSLGLRDNEDYSRPIRPFLSNTQWSSSTVMTIQTQAQAQSAAKEGERERGKRESLGSLSASSVYSQTTGMGTERTVTPPLRGVIEEGGRRETLAQEDDEQLELQQHTYPPSSPTRTHFGSLSLSLAPPQ